MNSTTVSKYYLGNYFCEKNVFRVLTCNAGIFLLTSLGVTLNQLSTILSF